MTTNIQKLKIQKKIILSHFFPNLKKDISIFTPRTSSDAVWVHGKPLRDFLACTETSIVNALTKSDILCPHRVGLHPSVARQGKLITKAMYNAYIQYFPPSDLDNSIVVTPGEHLCCPICKASLFLENL